MRRIIGLVISGLAISGLLTAQTLNVQVGNVKYLFPAEQAGQMPYSDGTTLTVMEKAFTLSEVDNMWVDETKVTDSSVQVAFSNDKTDVTVAGNIAKFLTISQSGAHVKIAQSDDTDVEITYTLSGSSSDGGFYTSGAYKACIRRASGSFLSAFAISCSCSPFIPSQHKRARASRSSVLILCVYEMEE